MKKAPTLEMAQRYQQIYDHFNEHLFKKIFGQPLPRPLLNFSRSRGAVAFFSPDAWTDPDTKLKVSEISLCPEWTGRDPRDVLSSLVHEMAHLLDHVDGTSAKNGYHSKTWFDIMEELGLPGLCIKGSKHRVHHTIEEDGAYAQAFKSLPEEFVLPFITSYPAQAKPAKAANRMGVRARYQCAQCALTVYAKYDARIACLTCDLEMYVTGPHIEKSSHRKTSDV